MSSSHEIRERLAARDPFSLAEVRRWMADEMDLELWAAVYEVLGPGWELIEPEAGMDEVCRFMTRYLLRCIHENVQNEGGKVPPGTKPRGSWRLASSIGRVSCRKRSAC